MDSGTLRWATMFANRNYCRCRRRLHYCCCYRNRPRPCSDSEVRPAILWLFSLFSRCHASNRFDFSTTTEIMCRTVSPIAFFALNWPLIGRLHLSSLSFDRVSSVEVRPQRPRRAPLAQRSPSAQMVVVLPLVLVSVPIATHPGIVKKCN